MSRTSVKLNCKNPKEAENTIQSILASNGYDFKEENGEQYYQNGVGFFTSPKFIAYSFNGNELTLEAWVRNFAISGESKLDGVVGAVPKRRCKGVFNSIIDSIDAEEGSVQRGVNDSDERSFFQKRIYKYDARTNELRISKTKVICWIWFILFFSWGVKIYYYSDIHMNILAIIFMSIIVGLIFTIPVYVVGYIISYFLDKRARNQG